MPIHSIAVLMTSFNRRDLTLKSLASLFNQHLTVECPIAVFLVNDGSTDGTDDAVRMRYPEVHVLQGDGTLFWNGGMRLAFETAAQRPFEAYLFLNDDTILNEGALTRMIACAQSWQSTGSPAIVVGSTKSPENGNHSYGGVTKRIRGLSLSFEKALPHASASFSCDTMNGNVVLIPGEIAQVVGNLDHRFRHQFGDLDYGLRAKRAGFTVVLAPGYVGECQPNAKEGSWRDSSLAFTKRWKHLTSPKGVPFREWLFFTRRHHGWRWPYYSVSPYVKTIASSLFARKSVGPDRRVAFPR